MPLLQILTDPQNFRFYAGGRGHVSNAGSFGQKSIPYGDDTKGGGSSNQPYIKSPIPDALTANPSDYILRGGLLNNAQTSAQDVSRLTQMFTDTKSTNGLFFTLKQQQLSATAVRTQASPSFGLNGQLYSPLNTLAQAGVVSQGIHLNKQGINPFAETGAYAQGEYLYFNKVKPNPNDPSGSLESNRLVQIYRGINENRDTQLDGFKFNEGGVNVLSYKGGPGAPLGIGNTNIRFADQRTGNNNPLKVSNSVYFLTGNRWVDRTRGSWISPVTNGASGKYEDYTGKIGSLIFNNNGPVITPDGGYTFNPNFYYNVYKSGSLTPYDPVVNSQKILKSVFNVTQSVAEGGLKIDPEKSWIKSSKYELPDTDVNTPQTSSFAYSNTGIINGVNGTLPQNVYTYSKTLIEKPGKDNTDVNLPTGNHLSPKTQDFRAVLRNNLRGQDKKNADQSGATAKSLSYDIGGNLTIEYRTNLGDPGARAGKSYFSYTAGVQGGGRSGQPLDKINALPIYTSETGPEPPRPGIPTNDLIAFRIGAIDNSNPTIVSYMHFRAFLNSFSDSYTGDWSGYNYLGRGEKFYTYNGFDRKLSLGFTAAAQSKEELIPMYKKLNFLASNLAPDYSGEYGYMKGCFVTLTVGGYLYEQPGFITNLSYDMITEMPWEIGINDTNEEQDPSVKQLSHMIKINSFDFTPIHNFIPQKQSLGVTNNGLEQVGREEYIALANPNDGSTNWAAGKSINQYFKSLSNL
jgi:hypothetical protein